MSVRNGKFVLATFVAMLLLAASSSQASAATFTTPGGQPVTVPVSGPGSPYPSTLEVEGASGSIEKITVNLSLSHEFVSDLDVLLVGPSGTAIILISDVCGGQEATGINLNLETGAAALPNTSTCTSGTYRPTNLDSGVDAYPAPAPGSTSTSLDYFLSGNPNGTWRLFVVDDNGGDSGLVNWTLTLQTTDSEIVIPATGSAGAAAPYPSTKTVLTPPGQVVETLRLDLDNIAHRRAQDLDIMLANDKGSAAVVMSDACGDQNFQFVDFSFADSNTNSLGETAGSCGISDVSPIDFGGEPDDWPDPAPDPSFGNFSDVFGGQTGGEWRLFAVDDSPGVSGFISSWNIELTTRPATGAGFNSISETGIEGGLATVRIGRDGPTPHGEATVKVTAEPGTAVSGDFNFPTRLVTLDPNLLLAELSASIVDDGIAEKDETFRIVLSEPAGDAALSDATRAVTITIPASKNATLKLGRTTLNRKKGMATVVARISSPGRVTVAGRNLRQVSKKSSKAGKLTMPIRVTGKAKRSLARTGKAKVRAKFTYRTLGGKKITKTRKLTLKLTRVRKS